MTGSGYETSHHHYHTTSSIAPLTSVAGKVAGEEDAPTKALEEGEAYHEKLFCENVFICS